MRSSCDRSRRKTGFRRRSKEEVARASGECSEKRCADEVGKKKKGGNKNVGPDFEPPRRCFSLAAELLKSGRERLRATTAAPPRWFVPVPETAHNTALLLDFDKLTL